MGTSKSGNWSKKLPIDRFMEKIKTEDDCWIWTGNKISVGYGTFWFNSKDRYAHRWSYEYFKGDIPKGMYICHRCDNPSCVNPEHLFLGTAKENSRDMISKGRLKGGVNNCHG